MGQEVECAPRVVVGWEREGGKQKKRKVARREGLNIYVGIRGGSLGIDSISFVCMYSFLEPRRVDNRKIWEEANGVCRYGGRAGVLV